MVFKSKSKKQGNKQVAFGENDTVNQFDRISKEERENIWYSPEELAQNQRRGSFQEEMKKAEVSPESYLHAQKIVKKVANTCRVRLEQSDGYWDKSLDKELSKIALAGSKDHREAATKRAKIVYKEVYGRDVRSLSPGPTRGKAKGSKFLSERVRSLSPFAKPSGGSKWQSLALKSKSTSDGGLGGKSLKKPTLGRHVTADTVLLNETSNTSVTTSMDEDLTNSPVRQRFTRADATRDVRSLRAPTDQVSTASRAVSTDC